MGDAATFESMVQLSEIIGLPLQSGGQKSYLFGQLLIGDEFQVWGKTMTPWRVSSEEAPRLSWPPLLSISRLYFYGIALGVGGILLGLSRHILVRSWNEFSGSDSSLTSATG